MQIKNDVRMFYCRVQTILGRCQRKQKNIPEISAPFNFKREPVCLPGISEDEISILRDKAAASRIGIADSIPLAHSALFSHPPSPIMTVLSPSGASTSSLTTN
ncbi:unnamed protein product [Clonostachys rosea]|uniref:Uncharacterized protein n=1 Tax=Bionectria ochroleuca TaxID=29856 RepID=A0ABY6TMW9_BIOOC|nr:unnamed protein product [Clonostachys rosea]